MRWRIISGWRSRCSIERCQLQAVIRTAVEIHDNFSGGLERDTPRMRPGFLFRAPLLVAECFTWENTMSQRHADHAHDHTNVPAEPALRVKALESLLVDKGSWIPPHSMCSWIPTRTRWVRVMEHRSSRRPGSTPPISNASWLTVRRRSPSSAFLVAGVKSSR